MNLTDRIIQFLKKEPSEQMTPDGLCPNCWGRQEYGGKFFEAINSEKVDLNNAEEKRGWIQAYIAKRLLGINLINKHGSTECPACKKTFEQSV
jgi:hypothetical protein